VNLDDFLSRAQQKVVKVYATSFLIAAAANFVALGHALPDRQGEVAKRRT
jgi:hypothetical protein